ncbi:hypothetical protein [Longimicrobium sp.]|uniref:hypothetical protein n=1 Tax=Longimicrobium sp. TaxID=2029185 RepID=UPI002C8E7EFF|nr:hypothetical protein [Longimicrobium sp.]HSU16950.1 hypothetical protein [Longimicrobium sp.]
MRAAISFPDLLTSLADLGRVVRENPELQARIQSLVEELRSIGEPTRASLAAFVSKHPDSVPVLATAAGLTREMLKNQLRHRLGSSSWTKLARTDADRLVEMLDEFDLVQRLSEQMRRKWTFADVLLERYLWSQRGASGAIGRGRSVEDQVEAVVRKLGLPIALRTQFKGRGGTSAPCDLAIPAGGEHAQIVIAMKGFNSTGSKLSDAVREIVAMAEARLPQQFVFAVVDGIGWKSRQADLRRIYELWERRSIDGLYTLAHLDRLEADLRAAAMRLGMNDDRQT